MSLPDALLKAILEADTEVSLLAGVNRGSFAPVFTIAATDAAAKLIAAHGITVINSSDAARTVVLAHQAAMSGGRAVALIGAEGIDRAQAAVRRVSALRLPERGGLCLVFEDAGEAFGRNRGAGQLRGQRLDQPALPTLEPSCVSEVREALDIALRLSRAASSPSNVIIHESLLRTSDMVHVRPNRVADSVDAMLARRRRRVPRWTADAGGVLRLARRLEVNVAANLPSPGERVPVGFITIGPARQTLAHVVGALDLFGRVPSLHLSMIHPIDDAAVSRLLGRCEEVVVLEPQPGELELQILSIAESMRHRNEDPAGVWGLLLPQPTGPPLRGALDANDHAMAPASPELAGLAPGDAIHPSRLVRKIAHLLQRIRPAVNVLSQLSVEPTASAAQVVRRGAGFGTAAAIRDLRSMLADVDQWLRDRAPLEEQGIAPSTLAIDGVRPEAATERIVHVELWERQQFLDEGVGAIRQAARSEGPVIFVVADLGPSDGVDLERLTRGVVPAERSDRVRIETADLTDQPALRELARNAALADRMTIILAHDGTPPLYDVAAIERTLAEIDRLGFQPRQKLLLPADEACDIRGTTDDAPPPGPTELGTFPLASSWQIERISKRLSSGIRVRVRPLLQQVEVVRTRPPIANWRMGAAERPTVPTPLHGSQAQWRAHLAGVRAQPPGLAAEALCRAGARMGYHVSCWHDPSPSGIGRRAWAQVLFTRPRSEDEQVTLTAALPFGEADLLLGLDSGELMRAISGEEELQVASAGRTCVVADLARAAQSVEGMPAPLDREAIELIAAVSRELPRYIDDVSEACRTWFHTDRVTDIALLGIAFQMGLIPATLDAVRGAVTSLESEGYGRCHEAFEFGRRLAVDSKLMTRPHDDRDDDLRRMARRAGRTMRRERGMNRSAAARFDRMLRQSLDRMPGLMETDAGRQACRDFVRGLYRCVAWGGTDYAQRYADLICNLYDVDRGDTGRSLTRDAVLPVAEAMLIRDPIYVATLAGSAEHRRRIRQWLNVRHARGDEIERRFLTRVDVVALGRRCRADVRSSDWLARLVASLTRVTPRSWRGTRHERDMREYVVDIARQAAQTSGHMYHAWTDIFRRLHMHAAENRLRGMALSEIRMLVESAMPAAEATPAQPVQSA